MSKKAAVKKNDTPRTSRRNPHLKLASDYAKAKGEVATIGERMERRRKAQVDDSVKLSEAAERETKALEALTGQKQAEEEAPPSP